MKILALDLSYLFFRAIYIGNGYRDVEKLTLSGAKA